MTWHIFKFESQLYLATSMKQVVSHVTQYHSRDDYHITMIPDDTLIKVENKVMTLSELTAKYHAQARQDGYTIDEDLSIYIRNGKAITIQKECDEMMG